jgi:methyl-accepting chemotaxis protein
VQITTAADQQLIGMEQIAQAMQSIHQVTAQTVSSARQSERAAEELSRLAGVLRDLVAQYQL